MVAEVGADGRAHVEHVEEEALVGVGPDKAPVVAPVRVGREHRIGHVPTHALAHRLAVGEAEGGRVLGSGHSRLCMYARVRTSPSSLDQHICLHCYYCYYYCYYYYHYHYHYYYYYHHHHHYYHYSY